MKFLEALNLRKKEIVSLVGAGGKTTTLYALGREAKEKGLKVVLTTTTKIYYPKASCIEDKNLKVVISASAEELYALVNKELKGNQLMVIAGGIDSGNPAQSSDKKLVGLDAELMEVLASTEADLIILEADGAARKPFKAPAPHEPVIPRCSTLVVPIFGIDCLNQPSCSETVHRPEIVAEIAGVSLGDKITPEIVAKVLTSERGYRKGLPQDAAWIPFINKVRTPSDLVAAREIGHLIRKVIPTKVLIGSALEVDPIKEVMTE